MGKFGKAFFGLILAAVAFPLLKGTFDLFTAPATGILVTMDVNGDGIPDVDTNVLAFITAIPWVLPLFILVWTIVDLVRPEQPDQRNMQ